MLTRALLILAASLLLPSAARFCPAAAAAAPDAGGAPPALTVVAATDLHYLARSLTDNGPFFMRLIESGDGKVMRYSEELIDAFVAQMIEKKPDAVILSGDLTFNGERESHERLAEKLAAVEAAGTRVLVLPGNHDLNMRIAARYEGEGYTLVPSVTAEEFAQIYGAFGYGEALARDAASLSYVAGLAPDLWALMLDVNGVAMPGYIPDTTLDWVAAQLDAAREKGARVLAVSHQNLLRHNDLLFHGFTIGNADALLPLYERGGVPVSLSGHIHMQHIAVSDSGLSDVATSSLAVSPNQYGVLRVYTDSLAYETEPVDVSAWAAANDLADPDLLDFAAYSARFFRGCGLRQTLAPQEQGSADARELADYLAAVNAAVFAGRSDLIAWDDALEERWRERGGFLSYYLNSLRGDCRDATRLTVALHTP